MPSSREKAGSDNKKLLFYTFIALIFIWMLYILIPQIFKDQTGRYIFDFIEHAVYFDRGKWFLEGTAPVSEYPQIPTYLFGLNNLLSMGFKGNMQQAAYSIFLSLEYMLIFFFVIKKLLELVPPEKKFLPYLMFLPTTLFWVFNRFDILPAFLCLLAYDGICKKRFIYSAILLAAATLTKWYPVLLFPALFFHCYSQEKKLPWKIILTFVVTCLVIILPTYLLGGMDALTFPYRLHASRGAEYFSFVVLANELLKYATTNPVHLQIAYAAFFILQVSAPVISLFTEFNTRENVLDYFILAIAIFILFSRVNSPQWILWLMPFLILSASSKFDLVLIILYSLWSYVSFPLIWDTFGFTSLPFKIDNTLSFILLGVFIVRSIRRLNFSLKNFAMLKKQPVVE